jgi:hypothetical protein
MAVHPLQKRFLPKHKAIFVPAEFYTLVLSVGLRPQKRCQSKTVHALNFKAPRIAAVSFGKFFSDFIGENWGGKK